MKEMAKVLFPQAHDELLCIGEDPEAPPEVLRLRQMLVDLGFEPQPVDDRLTADHLEGSKVLVLGAPKVDLSDKEVEVIRHFVEAGGGLLLVSDAYTMGKSLDRLNKLAEMAGLQFHEYLNYHPTWLQLFFPHYITASVDRVRVKDVAHIICSNGAYDLAVTRATRSTVIACGSIGQGRVVAAGDVDLFTDLLDQEGNTVLVANAFRWLASQNIVDIQEFTVPRRVKWGHSGTVVLKLYNGNAKVRPQVECVLESDVDALISEPASKKRSVPPGRTTQMQWAVTPQTLGDQKLRLTVHITGQPSLYFDQLLPEMLCEAPGYLTLQTTNEEDGEPETKFQTGDRFVAAGALHWPTGLEPPPYQLELEYTEGLIEQGYQPGEGVGRWHLQAVARGTHTLTLKIRQTGQSLPAVVTVQSSLQDQLTELRAAYVYPLDAEIAERLQAVDRRLSDEAVRDQPFTILPPDEYIREVYDAKAVTWLKEVLAAARREQWYNLDLLNHVLIYLAPAYLPGRGSFVPYDPALASHLARLHPTARWRLESNLVRSEESEDINVRQSIAAYLLHEKYGHGFFYTHTRLGQQLAILQRHRFSEELDNESYKDYVRAARLIKDSAIIVNEGFAAWMELTFLGKLDREVRQAVLPRRILLLQEATGLYERQRDSFFQTFLPRFDSPYREGFEYLDFISQHFNLCCAVQVFLIATNVEFGISEDNEGRIQFESEATEIERRVLEAEEDDARSHLRLRGISELLYDQRKDLQAHIRKHHCPEDCRDGCPLEKLIEERLGWRNSRE
jgi:hypothetical protein